MKIIVDMNMSPKWVGALENAGFAAVHWSAIGQVTADDIDIAEDAAANGSIVLTRDLDFPALLAKSGRTAPSVVLLREGDRFEPVLVARVLTALRSLAEELSAGAIVSISGNGLRVRRLPIGREGGV